MKSSTGRSHPRSRRPRAANVSARAASPSGAHNQRSHWLAWPIHRSRFVSGQDWLKKRRIRFSPVSQAYRRSVQGGRVATAASQEGFPWSMSMWNWTLPVRRLLHWKNGSNGGRSSAGEVNP